MIIRNIIFLFVFLISSAVSNSYAQVSGGIAGWVVDANTKKPLAGATVQIINFSSKVVTDSGGRYLLGNLKVGTYAVTVTFVGYLPQTKFNIPVNSGNENEVSFEMQIEYDTRSAVIVNAGKRTARASSLATPLSVQRLTAEEIKSNPGGNFDISRVINSLPGVGGSAGSVGGFRNDIIIRGGGPGENVFYLDGIEIPVINHFATQGSGGGPTGILNVAFIEDVKLSSSAFDAKFDNALSSVFEFKQKLGSTKSTQGNARLSATEFAATLEGPLNKKKSLTYLASIRRSYLQLLFKAIDLPIRPNFWDFQYKVSYRPNNKGLFTFLGIGAIDEFGFGSIKTATQDKIYTLNQSPSIQQKSYAIGGSYRRTLAHGYYLITMSRNGLTNNIEKYDFNDASNSSNLRYRTDAKEIENKVRFEMNTQKNNWKLSYGAVVQYLQYYTNNNIRRRAAVGSQPEDRYLYQSDIDFFRIGGFVQAGKKFANNRLGINAGLRTDINTFSNDGSNPANAFSPRIALSYLLNSQWTLNASVGRYSRMAPYTVLGFRNNNGELVNKDNHYISNVHYVAGVEFLPTPTTRFTLEGFYKKYNRVPVTVKDGISINNLGADFGAVGNEAVTPIGKGETSGIEFFAQQKLTSKFFGIFSYTYFFSRFSNGDGRLIASAWDNRHLLSATLGYKFPRNWELGLKYRYQGGAPYTPFDQAQSQLNFMTQGQGVLDYNQFNTQRLSSFSSSDVRIDKKWNLKKLTIDVYLDVSNWWAAKSVAYPQYTFEADLQTFSYISTDGLPVKQDGSNGIPLLLKGTDPVVLPTLGFIVEF